MTGPEHFRKAEELAKIAARQPESSDALALIGLAQVHATLATVQTAAIGTSPQLETEPATTYVYRAAWGMTPLDTYTNQAAARTHCMADATNHEPDPTGLTFDWLGDDSEPDDPYELLMAINGDEQPTDYTVTRIEVAAEYDPEADA